MKIAIGELKKLLAYARGKSVAFRSETVLANGYTLQTQPYTVTFSGRPVRTIFHYYILTPDGRTCVENTSAETFARVASRWMEAHPITVTLGI